MQGIIELFVRNYDSPNTRHSYRHVLNGYVNWCRANSIDALGPEDADIERYVAGSGDQGPYRLSVLRSFYRSLWSLGMVERLPKTAALKEEPERPGVRVVRGLRSMEVNA